MMKRQWAEAVGLGLFALIFCAFYYQVHRLHADSLDDILRARGCLELNICPQRGASTTISGIEQGALFYQVLAGFMEQGWSLSEIWFLSFFFVGIGVALLYVGVRFYFGVGPAVVAS